MHFKTSTLLALLLSTQGLYAETLGIYLRNGTEPVRVYIENNQLFCTRTSDAFEICNGMDEVSENTWQGRGLKNPDGPRWVSARGTITITDSEMALEGCMMGGAICKSMTWPAQQE